MADNKQEKYPHIVLQNNGSTEKFISPPSGGGGTSIPERDRQIHGSALLTQVKQLKTTLTQATQVQRDAGMDEGVLQADGYSGYSKICRENNLTRIGCWDHARRKFVEADKSADSKAKAKAKKGTVSKTDVALSYIRKLYRIESNIADKTDEERLKAHQEISVPVLNEFKQWLEKNAAKIMKGGALRKAIDYTLNQWPYLVGYCERGDLKISNALAENAIRPFAIGRKNWLFADTRKGAEASAACYSLIETA